MSETKTAPFRLPLHIEETTSPKHFYLQDTEGFLRATTDGGDDPQRNREIATFIVQAVNSYQVNQELIKEMEGTIGVILNSVDYTAEACRLNEMVGAVLPKELIEKAHAILTKVRERWII
jgi:hypothetical protein